MDMKKYLKKLLREGLNGNPINSNKLCHICRLKAISINESKFKGVLTEQEVKHKLNDVLLILEKTIEIGKTLNDKLKGIDSNLAKNLLAFFNSDKIKDSANVDYIDYSEEDEKLFTLVSTNAFIDPKTNEKGPNFGKQEAKKFKLSTLLNYLGSSIQNIKDYEIEELISHFQEADISQMEEVSGDDILKAYHCANYDEGVGKEDMGSCMSSTAAQEYLEIYTANPEQVSCVVLLNPKDKTIRGRALIWTTTDGTRVMDKVYTTNNEYNKYFNKYAEAHGLITDRNDNYNVALENGGEYKYYPYMDTFMHYTPDNGILSTYDGKTTLQSTTGGSSETNYSEMFATHYSEDEASYSEYYDDYIPHDEATMTYNDQYVLYNDVTRLTAGEYEGEDALDDDVVKLTAGNYDGEYVLKDEAVEDYEGNIIFSEEAYNLDNGEYRGEYALGQDVVEIYENSGYALRKESVELTAGQYEEEWCLREDAYVLLEGDEQYGIISVDDLSLDTYEDIRYVTFEEFEEKGAEAFN